MSSASEDNEIPNRTVSFKEAFCVKYCEEHFKAVEFNYIYSTSPTRKAPQPNNRHRKILSLYNHKIGFAGPSGQIAAICPSVEDLDLGKNEFTNWCEVLQIISQLQNLEVLNLSENPLSCKADIASLLNELPTKNLPLLKKLALDNTRVPLQTVYSLLHIMTGIQELYLSMNSYTDIPESKDTFQSVRSLYLSGHLIQTWEQIGKLGEIFPSLEELVMTECNLETITPDKVVNHFSQLKVLNLNKSRLCNWSAIDALCAFPALTHVSLLGIPLLDPLTHLHKRQFVIARLPTITQLNKSEITTKEREDAERIFIRHYMEQEQQPDRYQELVNVHGRLQKLAEVDMAPKNTVILSILFEDHTPFTQEVDVKQTTANFKRHLGNILGLSPADFRLFHHDATVVQSEEMKFSSKALYRYRMNDGDEIYVQKRYGI